MLRMLRRHKEGGYNMETTAEKLKEITAIENKYGLMLFRMGLTHLVDVGVRHLDDETVEESIKQIIAKGEEDKANGVIVVMTPEFQCDIIRCAAELAKVSIWDLFLYIKEFVTIGTKQHDAGTCPNCGNGDLEYRGGKVVENDYIYNWACEECGAFGREYFDMVFSEQIVDGEGDESDG